MCTKASTIYLRYIKVMNLLNTSGYIQNLSIFKTDHITHGHIYYVIMFERCARVCVCVHACVCVRARVCVCVRARACNRECCFCQQEQQ